MKDYLIEGVHDDTKALLVASNPDTLRQLFDNANQIEKGLKMANKLNYGSNLASSNIEKNLELINTQLSKLCTESNETRERIESMERQGRSREIYYDDYGRRVHDRNRNRFDRYANHSRESSADYSRSRSQSRSLSRERYHSKPFKRLSLSNSATRESEYNNRRNGKPIPKRVMFDHYRKQSETRDIDNGLRCWVCNG